MKFLLDQDVYAATLRFLSGLGHDVIPVAQIGLAQATDEDLLKTAQDQNRIFVTRDRDFGNLENYHLSVSGFLAELDRMNLDVREYLWSHPGQFSEDRRTA